jgi:hypothetical protein
MNQSGTLTIRRSRRSNRNWGIMKLMGGWSPMSTEPEEFEPTEFLTDEQIIEEVKETRALRVIGWFSIGMAVAALGLYVGSELRSRYKFKRRTPYDFYSNAGGQQASEFGVGI